MSHEYMSLRDGSYFRKNDFLSEPRIGLGLNVDNFETCNTLGTSRKRQDCVDYWVLANFPLGSHSTLTSIYLSVLCKTDDKVIQDLKILEEVGVYVPLFMCKGHSTICCGRQSRCSQPCWFC